MNEDSSAAVTVVYMDGDLEEVGESKELKGGEDAVSSSDKSAETSSNASAEGRGRGDQSSGAGRVRAIPGRFQQMVTSLVNDPRDMTPDPELEYLYNNYQAAPWPVSEVDEGNVRKLRQLAARVTPFMSQYLRLRKRAVFVDESTEESGTGSVNIPLELNEQLLRCLRTIPHVFFSGNFDVGKAGYLARIPPLHDTAAPTQTPGQPGSNGSDGRDRQRSQSGPTPPRGEALRRKEAREACVEQLSGYLEMAEENLLLQLMARRSQFFKAVRHVTSLRESVRGLQTRIASLKDYFTQMQPRLRCQYFAVLQTRRRVLRMEQVIAMSEAVKDTLRAMSTIQDLIGSGQYTSALQLMLRVNGLVGGGNVLSKIKCLKSVPEKLSELRAAVGQLVTEELLALCVVPPSLHVDERRVSVGSRRACDGRFWLGLLSSRDNLQIRQSLAILHATGALHNFVKALGGHAQKRLRADLSGIITSVLDLLCSPIDRQAHRTRRFAKGDRRRNANETRSSVDPRVLSLTPAEYASFLDIVMHHLETRSFRLALIGWVVMDEMRFLLTRDAILTARKQRRKDAASGKRRPERPKRPPPPSHMPKLSPVVVRSGSANSSSRSAVGGRGGSLAATRLAALLSRTVVLLNTHSIDYGKLCQSGIMGILRARWNQPVYFYRSPANLSSGSAKSSAVLLRMQVRELSPSAVDPTPEKPDGEGKTETTGDESKQTDKSGGGETSKNISLRLAQVSKWPVGVVVPVVRSQQGLRVLRTVPAQNDPTVVVIALPDPASDLVAAWADATPANHHTTPQGQSEVVGVVRKLVADRVPEHEALTTPQTQSLAHNAGCSLLVGRCRFVWSLSSFRSLFLHEASLTHRLTWDDEHHRNVFALPFSSWPALRLYADEVKGGKRASIGSLEGYLAEECTDVPENDPVFPADSSAALSGMRVCCPRGRPCSSGLFTTADIAARVIGGHSYDDLGAGLSAAASPSGVESLTAEMDEEMRAALGPFLESAATSAARLVDEDGRIRSSGGVVWCHQSLWGLAGSKWSEAPLCGLMLRFARRLDKLTAHASSMVAQRVLGTVTDQQSTDSSGGLDSLKKSGLVLSGDSGPRLTVTRVPVCLLPKGMLLDLTEFTAFSAQALLTWRFMHLQRYLHGTTLRKLQRTVVDRGVDLLAGIVGHCDRLVDNAMIHDDWQAAQLSARTQTLVNCGFFIPCSREPKAPSASQGGEEQQTGLFVPLLGNAGEVLQYGEVLPSSSGQGSKESKSDDGTQGSAGLEELDGLTGHRFAVAKCMETVLECVELYLHLSALCPLVAVTAWNHLVAMLGRVNSRACQLVFGAGAMPATGVGSITAANLAVASSTVGSVLSVIPLVRFRLLQVLGVIPAVPDHDSPTPTTASQEPVSVEPSQKVGSDTSPAGKQSVPPEPTVSGWDGFYGALPGIPVFPSVDFWHGAPQRVQLHSVTGITDSVVDPKGAQADERKEESPAGDDKAPSSTPSSQPVVDSDGPSPRTLWDLRAWAPLRVQCKPFATVCYDIRQHQRQIFDKVVELVRELLGDSCDDLRDTQWLKEASAHIPTDSVYKAQRQDIKSSVRSLMKQISSLHRMLSALMSARQCRVIFREISQAFSSIVTQKLSEIEARNASEHTLLKLNAMYMVNKLNKLPGVDQEALTVIQMFL